MTESAKATMDLGQMTLEGLFAEVGRQAQEMQDTVREIQELHDEVRGMGDRSPQSKRMTGVNRSRPIFRRRNQAEVCAALAIEEIERRMGSGTVSLETLVSNWKCTLEYRRQQ